MRHERDSGRRLPREAVLPPERITAADLLIVNKTDLAPHVSADLDSCRHARPARPTTEAATYDVRLTAGEHAHLRRLPQPFISAADSNLQQAYTVELAATSQFLLREEQLLVVTHASTSDETPCSSAKAPRTGAPSSHPGRRPGTARHRHRTNHLDAAGTARRGTRARPHPR